MARIGPDRKKYADLLFRAAFPEAYAQPDRCPALIGKLVAIKLLFAKGMVSLDWMEAFILAATQLEGVS